MNPMDPREFGTRHGAGLQTRREMIGESRTDATMAAMTEFDRPLQEVLNTYVFNDIWNRAGLPRSTRSMLVIALLCALNRPNELRVHLKAALTNGVSRSEIQEVLLQSLVYAGVPAGVEGFRIAKEVFRDIDEPSPSLPAAGR